jgi:formylmethanofuran:tetrahydromethanopterin formyltransferase
MRLKQVVFPLAALALIGCGEGIEGAKQAAVDAAAGAANVAAQFVTTEQACLATGQNEAFCGCLQTELGERLTPAQIEAVATVIRDGLTQGMQAAAEGATTIDPATRDAIVGCAAQGAVETATEAEGQ